MRECGNGDDRAIDYDAFHQIDRRCDLDLITVRRLLRAREWRLKQEGSE